MKYFNLVIFLGGLSLLGACVPEANKKCSGDQVLMNGLCVSKIANNGPEQNLDCGVVLNHQEETRIMYQSSLAVYPDNCKEEVQKRSCENGQLLAWSGSFKSISCSNERTRYAASSVVAGQSCQSEVQTQICQNGQCGAWSPNKFGQTSCQVQGYLSCGNIPHNGSESRVAYNSSLVAYGQVCVQQTQTRTCNNGSWSAWSGTYTNLSCSVQAAAACGTIASGQYESRTRYQSSSVDGEKTCVSEIQNRQCNNGQFTSWSGSFTQPICVTSRIRYESATAPNGGVCNQETQTMTCEGGLCGIWTPNNFTNTACTTGNFNRSFTVARGPSRTSGVAPLSVHFSAGFSASTPTSRSFHDYEYSWNFGDQNGGIWGTSKKSKNIDKGPLAGHVYETPGTYTVTLTVRNSSGVVDSDNFTITVQDPNIIFSGTNTTCISASTNFTGCPAGASQITTSNLSVLANYAAAGKRILLQRGSVWSMSADIAFPNNAGPVHIGAFGNCTSPDELGICSNAPRINISGDVSFLSLTGKQDWRLADIAFVAPKGASSVFSGYTDIKRNLILKISSVGFGTPVWWTNWRYNDEDYHINNALVSSRITDASDTVAYLGCEKLMVLGNIIQNSDTTHILRVWHGYLGVIAHNILSGTSLTNTNGRHALKLHSPQTSSIGTFAQTSNGGLKSGTQFTVIANNVFGSSGPWPVSIGPQDSQHIENLSDILIEKNKMLAGYGLKSAMTVQVGLMFEGRYFTVRNNLIDGTEGANGYTGIYVARRGIEWTPLGNKIYNNTIYSRDPNSNGAQGIQVDSSASDTIIRNNYVSYPNTANKQLVNDTSSNAVMSNNVLTNTPYFVDPNNPNPLLRNFQITSSATAAIDKGYIVPVFSDFNDVLRTGIYDLGAFAY